MVIELTCVSQPTIKPGEASSIPTFRPAEIFICCHLGKKYGLPMRNDFLSHPDPLPAPVFASGFDTARESRAEAQQRRTEEGRDEAEPSSSRKPNELITTKITFQ
jgi:hypothetical protein